jgi:hypothetical protein
MRMRSGFFLALLVSLVAYADGGRVYSFWERTDEATLVVVAHVESVRESADDGHAIAVLQINETLKGSASPTVEVEFWPHFICPAPARYFEGDTMLTFLALKSGRQIPLGGADAVRTGTPEEMKALTDAVKHALAAKKTNTPEARRSWALESFTEPQLRFDAVRELKPLPLNDDEYVRVKAALLAKPDCETLATALELVSSRPDAEITTLAVNALETLVAHPTYSGVVFGLLDQLEARLGVPRAELEADKKVAGSSFRASKKSLGSHERAAVGPR